MAAAARPSLDELVEAFAETAFVEPEEGATLFAFFTREQHRSLEADEVRDLLAKKKGAYVIELVYDDELELLQRGEGRVVRDADDLVALAVARCPRALPKGYVGEAAGRDPTIASKALPDEGGRGKPTPKTAIPWHPSSIELPAKRQKQRK